MSNEARPERLALLKQLTHLFSESGCSEFEFEGEGFSLKMKTDQRSRRSDALGKVHTENSKAPVKDETVVSTSGAPGPTDMRRTISSGITGLFFRASAPGKEPFVSIGDKVAFGQTLCLVEAMKMLNAIECEFDGQVVEILQQDGADVAVGAPLFIIEVADV